MSSRDDNHATTSAAVRADAFAAIAALHDVLADHHQDAPTDNRGWNGQNATRNSTSNNNDKSTAAATALVVTTNTCEDAGVGTGTGAAVTNKKNTKRELYLERLKSFSPITYFAKPVSLSPIRCARFGWKNSTDDRDMLICTCCHAALAIYYPPKGLSLMACQNLTQMYEQQMTGVAHTDACIYRQELQFYKDEPSGTQQLSTVSLVPLLYMSVLSKEDIEMFESSSTVVKPFLQRWKKIRETLMLQYSGFDHTTDGQQEQQHDSSDGGEDNNIIQWMSLSLQLPDEKLGFLSTSSADDMDTSINIGGRDADTVNNLRKWLEQIVSYIRDEGDNMNKNSKEQEASKSDVPTPALNNKELETFSAALALFGWNNNVNAQPSTTAKVDAVTSVAAQQDPDTTLLTKSNQHAITFECSLCLSSLSISPKLLGSSKIDKDSTTNTEEEKSEEEPPPKKRQKTSNDKEAHCCNPLSSHRYYCPYVCGFPTTTTKATPLWNGLMTRIVKQIQTSHKEQGVGKKRVVGEKDRLIIDVDGGVSNDSTAATTKTTAAKDPLEAYHSIHRELRASISPRFRK